MRRLYPKLINLPEKFVSRDPGRSRRAKTPAKLSAAKWRPDSIYFWCIPAERMEKPNSQTMFRWEESLLILLECQQSPSPPFFLATLLPFSLAFCFRSSIVIPSLRDSNMLVRSQWRQKCRSQIQNVVPWFIS